jgi:hypothetical protein
VVNHHIYWRCFLIQFPWNIEVSFEGHKLFSKNKLFESSSSRGHMPPTCKLRNIISVEHSCIRSTHTSRPPIIWTARDDFDYIRSEGNPGLAKVSWSTQHVCAKCHSSGPQTTWRLIDLLTLTLPLGLSITCILCATKRKKPNKTRHYSCIRIYRDTCSHGCDIPP